MAGSPESFYATNPDSQSGHIYGTSVAAARYNGSASACTTTAITLPISQIDTYETLNGQQHGSKLTYNAFGLLTSETDYDFSTNTTTHGTALRNGASATLRLGL